MGMTCTRRTLIGIALLGFALGSVAGPALITALRTPSAQAGETRAAAASGDGKLRIIAFGAHPDDCELQVGGTGALWAAQGHHVKLVSVTNGDIGHWGSAGGPLAQRRLDEVRRADALLGATTEVLDIHDGELMPTLENRRLITRLIREWKADIVFAPRTNDYHPDHRYTGVLVQDSAFMVTVPFFVPDVPYLRNNPVFMLYTDRFQKPQPSRAEVTIDIGPVLEKKLDALGIMESQFLEGGANGSAELRPSDPARLAERRQQVRENFRNRNRNLANRFRKELGDWYGKERGDRVMYAEAFEIGEYGRQPTRDELKKLFP